ncbi:MAG: putative DNA binding domain-containing protein [Planctomycetaceae bacterium]|nr:putative DNA binding domain-containing protein [Planctomycetaceae bacterium]
MNTIELLDIIRNGKTNTVQQFKQEIDDDKITAEMIAMANSKGGMIIIGVQDTAGNITGLSYEQLQSYNNRLATIANDKIKPQIFIFTEVVTVNVNNEDKKVLIITIQEGINKPYKDKNGTIWIKQGSDKRKLTDNAEIMRLFQQSGMLFIDEMIVPNTSQDDIDFQKVKKYIKRIETLSDDLDVTDDINKNLLNNLGIMRSAGLTLGGLLFFGNNPQQYRPEFCIKAISFFGNSIGGNSYRDNIEITGTITELFEEGIRFFKTSLLHKQNGQNFNSLGILEISEIALEELLQNAIVHRDYSINASIRLMIFDNRVEITSPGCLPNSLTVEAIKMGRAAVRNNLLRTYCSKMMNYRGFGSGIVRALKEQPNIEFINDTISEQFIVKIPRTSDSEQ